MPSVPQSLLWISLVVLWLFVLVPMLISKRDAVRRTSDVALATRVLNSGLSVRKLKRGAPAAGHRSDPDWQPSEDLDDDLDADEPVRRAVVVAAATNDRADRDESDYLDVDVVEDSGALPVGAVKAEEPAEAVHEEPESAETAETKDAETKDGAEDDEELAAEAPPAENDGTSDEYEYVEDTSGLESGEEPPTTMSRSAARRREHETNTAAAVSARKYRFRKRVLSVMVLSVMATAVAALTVWPDGWWACGVVGALMVLYLGYLRRQTRIEEQLRRRRVQRMARARAGVVNTRDPSNDVPSRLRRPGSVVLEVDDEDPIFEHLDYAPGPMDYRLPRAAGE